MTEKMQARRVQNPENGLCAVLPYVFDSNTGKATEIGNSNNIYAYVAGDGIAMYDSTSKKLSVLNWNDYKDMGFDLSGYDVSNEGIYAATEDYIAFIAKNPDGDAYTIIMKKDGSLVVDPIKGTSESWAIPHKDCTRIAQSVQRNISHFTYSSSSVLR